MKTTAYKPSRIMIFGRPGSGKSTFGNNSKSFEIRWDRADLVIYFNYPRWLCYFRALKRYFFKDPAIDDRAENCPETIRWSLLKYMWSFNERIAKPIEVFSKLYPGAAFYEIRNDKELDALYLHIVKVRS